MNSDNHNSTNNDVLERLDKRLASVEEYHGKSWIEKYWPIIVTTIGIIWAGAEMFFDLRDIKENMIRIQDINEIVRDIDILKGATNNCLKDAQENFKDIDRELKEHAGIDIEMRSIHPLKISQIVPSDEKNKIWTQMECLAPRTFISYRNQFR